MEADERPGMLDNILTLVILYTSMNLPIAVWMMRSFLAEVPMAILEAARIDGAGLIRTLVSVVMPIAAPGMAATSLICFIFSWNEFMFAVNLTAWLRPPRSSWWASSPARDCSWPSCAPLRPWSRSRPDRGLRRPGQAGARALARRGQVTHESGSTP